MFVLDHATPPQQQKHRQPDSQEVGRMGITGTFVLRAGSGQRRLTSRSTGRRSVSAVCLIPSLPRCAAG